MEAQSDVLCGVMDTLHSSACPVRVENAIDLEQEVDPPHSKLKFKKI